uniref:Uncharacterized protein n=1 Tax=Micrurus paraensis TaxID=1970185 RepID=A0A2D4KGU8_9SAUR
MHFCGNHSSNVKTIPCTLLETCILTLKQCGFNHVPECFLLGIMSKKYNKDELYLIIHIITAARTAFAQNWKETDILSEDEVMNKILICTEMNKLTLEMKNKDESAYYAIWDITGGSIKEGLKLGKELLTGYMNV